MIEFHKRVATYNLVNIISTCVLSAIQVLNAIVFDSAYLILLDNDILAIIVLWPLMILVGIIIFNKSMLRNFIHTQNKMLYEANNVNADFIDDEGSLDSTAWEALPTSNVRRVRVKKNADMKFYGRLDDIGIMYALDEFKYKLIRKRRDDTELLGSIVGEALVVRIPQKRFGPKWTLYINDAFTIRDIKIKQNSEEKFNVGSESGRILYDDFTKLKNIRRTLASNSKLFANGGKIIAMFKEDTFIYISDSKSKFKMKLPFIISKPRLEQIIVDQKAQVYRFNQFLVDISRTLEL